ncbi:hypothetical protein GCM10027265_24780 [Jatrophihabitans fulvus]
MPAAARPAHVSFRIGTHNTLHGTSGYTPFAGIIGWQELDGADDIARMRRSLPGFAHYVPRDVSAAADSISWRRSLFTLRYARAVFTHSGQAHVTPSRWVTYVVLRVRATGRTIAFVNTHFISHAFTSHAERRGRWYRHEDVLEKVVRQLRAHGWPVLAVGDYNSRAGVPLTGLSRFRVRTGDPTPIDQLYAPRGAHRSLAHRLWRNGSDHHAYRAWVRI